MKALFVLVDGGGNVPPQLGIAAELQRRGHAVTVLAPAGLSGTVQGAGLDFEPLRRGRQIDLRAPKSGLATIRDLAALFGDRGVGEDAIAGFRRTGADVTVVDTMCTAAIDRLVRGGVPTVALVHSFFAFFRAIDRSPMGLALRLRGMPAERVQAAADARLVTTRADLDPATALPSGVRHVGVVWQGQPVEAIGAARPKVLVSLSTIPFPGQERTFQAILDALAPLPVEVVATTGPSIVRETLRLPSGVELHDWLDHGEVLPTASLVIGHGGHSTTMRAASYGVPVLVMPSSRTMDQPMVGAAVAAVGAGATLPRTASVATIRDEVTRLLADDGIHEGARRLGRDIRHLDGAAVAADAIEEVAARRGAPEPS